jgi:acetyl-CoA C-acetyltransferase
VKLVESLRADPGASGLLSAVSGILTKQGVSLWSAEPPERPFAFFDVTEETAREQAPLPLVERAEGPARVAGYTVLCEGEQAARLVCICELAGGRRTLAASDDPALAELGMREELAGRSVRLAGGRAELG